MLACELQRLLLRSSVCPVESRLGPRLCFLVLLQALTRSPQLLAQLRVDLDMMRNGRDVSRVLSFVICFILHCIISIVLVCIMPVVKYATKQQQVEACISASPFWYQFRIRSLFRHWMIAHVLERYRDFDSTLSSLLPFHTQYHVFNSHYVWPTAWLMKKRKAKHSVRYFLRSALHHLLMGTYMWYYPESSTSAISSYIALKTK